MDLKTKFEKLQDPGRFDKPQPSIQLKRVHEACQQGPLLHDVADNLVDYIAHAVIAVEKPLEMINGYDWADGTRELVTREFIDQLVMRFMDGNPESEKNMRRESIDALATFLASQTDLAYYHGT